MVSERPARSEVGQQTLGLEAGLNRGFLNSLGDLADRDAKLPGYRTNPGTKHAYPELLLTPDKKTAAGNIVSRLTSQNSGSGLPSACPTITLLIHA
jgi:hypothetical protein